MNPLIQLNRQLQYLFIALLLGCFAIAQSAQAQDPNHRVINLNFTAGPVKCSFMDKVPVSGNLNIVFAKNGNGKVVPTSVTLNPFNAGPGSNSGRNYTGTVEVTKVLAPRPHDNIAFLVVRLTAQPNPPGQADLDPGVPKQFSIRYEITWAYANGKVTTFFHLRPEICGCGLGCEKL